MIGSGGFGKVYKVAYLNNGKIYALKKVDVKAISRSTGKFPTAIKQAIFNEANLTSFLSQENDSIIKIVDLYDYNSSLWVYLELMSGALTDIILDHSGYYSEEFCKYSLYKTAHALHRMHSKQILHRDIKSDNILYNSKGEIKVCDLGFAVALI